MPQKPKRPCAYPNCPNLTDGQYCEEHRKEARQNYDRYRRSPDTAKKYGRAWHRIRARYAAKHPLCEKCLGEGRLNPVEEGITSCPYPKAAITGRPTLCPCASRAIRRYTTI